MTFPPNTMNIRRGHESEEHRALKREILTVLHRWGYEFSVCEHLCCDVVVLQCMDSRQHILGFEAERSVRNVINNLTRDFSQGCDIVTIVCPDWTVMSQVSRKIAREIPQELWCRIGLTNIVALRLFQPISISEHCNLDNKTTQ